MKITTKLGQINYAQILFYLALLVVLLTITGIILGWFNEATVIKETLNFRGRG